MKFRKLTSLLTACAMLCTTAAVLPEMPETMSITASAEETAEYTEGTYELLTYRNYGDHIEISDCDDTATEVVIPEEIDGVKVTSIGESAFYYCESLTEITIPDSVTSIGDWAFGNCTNLTAITISFGFLFLCYTKMSLTIKISVKSSYETIGQIKKPSNQTDTILPQDGTSKCSCLSLVSYGAWQLSHKDCLRLLD